MAAAKKDGAPNGSPFNLTPVDLEQLHVPGREAENLQVLRTMGGADGLCEKLKTSPSRGVDGSPEDLELRRRIFGENTYKAEPLESE
jgi:hypothetical protein